MGHYLLDNDDVDNETNDTHKHSPFFNENQFINLMSSNNGLSILDLNVCNAFTKYDELALFVNRVNINNPISVICLNECWLSVQSDVSFLHLPNYDMYYQVGNCPGHTHCGLITCVTCVHNFFLRRRFISTKQIYKKIIHTIPYTLYTREKK